jgi:ribosome-binding protein aMBF1 (putative translation factor)
VNSEKVSVCVYVSVIDNQKCTKTKTAKAKTTNNKQQTTNNKQQTTNNEQQTTNNNKHNRPTHLARAVEVVAHEVENVDAALGAEALAKRVGVRVVNLVNLFRRRANKSERVGSK